MTLFYLQVLVDDLSICLDSDVHYYHHYKVGDIVEVEMSSDRGPIVSFGYSDYDAVFTHKWDSGKQKRYTIVSLIQLGYVVDITKSINRQNKLKQIGI